MNPGNSNLRKKLNELNASKDSLGLRVATVGGLIGFAGALIAAYGPHGLGKVIFGVGFLLVFFGILFTFAVVIKKGFGG